MTFPLSYSFRRCVGALRGRTPATGYNTPTAHFRNRRCLAKMPTTLRPRVSRSSPRRKPPPSRSKSAAAVPDIDAPSRTVRPPFRLFNPFSAGLDQFQPTAFKAPVRTSVATEFNPEDHEYDTIPARHQSIRARGNFMPKRKAPFAVLVTLGRVGNADARGGGELDARAVIPLSPLPHAPPQTCSRRNCRHSSAHPRL